ncbi:hypothetical protein SAMN02910339_01389 [Lachnospiraceae bacterium YSD2013]|nr:hypothetical protein SAMN02910339_01389 [Lachnospiraceae bacterium YSD2013]
MGKNTYACYSDMTIDSFDSNYSGRSELIEALIPSKDVRNYHGKINYKYSQFVLASLIVHGEIPYFRKVDELKKIMNETSDNTLKAQIEEYVDFMEYSYKSFVCNKDNEYVYRVETYDGEEEEEKGLFQTYSGARKYSLSLRGTKYTIYKTKVFQNSDEAIEAGKSLYCNEHGSMSFDKKGELRYCYARDIVEPEYSKDTFYEAYVYIPFPFRQGDFVVDIKDQEIGMIAGPKNDDEVKEMYVLKTDNYDYSDYLINVEFLRKGNGKFNWAYDHCSPLYLEYSDHDFENPDLGTIEIVMAILKRVKQGNGMIFDLEYAVNEYRKKQEQDKKDGDLG